MKTLPYFHFEKKKWFPSPRPRMAFYDYPDTLDPEIKREIRYLKNSQRDWWKKNHGDTRAMTRRSPKKKCIEFSQCIDCLKYADCKSLCKKVKKYVFQDVAHEYTDWTNHVSSSEDLSAEADPENAPNDPIDNVFLFSTDIRETYPIFLTGSFENQ